MKNKLRKCFKVLLIISVLLCIAMVGVIFADSYDGPEPNGKDAYINATDKIANVRKGADSTYELIGVIENGEKIDVYGEVINKKNQKWYYIYYEKFNNENEKWTIIKGWTHESNIKFDKKK